MIKKHTIIGSNIILFLDFNFEVGSFNGEKKIFKDLLNNYLKKNNIATFGKKIFLVCGGILLATFIHFDNDIFLYSINNNYTYTSYFSEIDKFPVVEKNINTKNKTNYKKPVDIESKKSKSNIEKETNNKINSVQSSSEDSKSNTKNNVRSDNSSNKKDSEKSVSNKEKTPYVKNLVTVYRNNGSVLEIELEEYLIGVVAAEMPASFNIEALKAQAILSRTYALKSKQTGKKLTDTVSTQAYIDIKQMKSKWKNQYSKYYNKIKQAVDATKGMYVTYNGTIIDAVYHSTSNGYTEDAIYVWGYSVPYLKSVESYLDKNVSTYKKIKEFEMEEFLNILGISSVENIEIISRNSSGRVSSVKVGNAIYNGIDFRNLLSLRSTDFDIEIIENSIRITTRGYGHGVGMSQYGANELAKKGYSYSKIIKYYYSGVKISNL